MVRLAEKYYNINGTEGKILGDPLNNLQIYPEQRLETLLAQGDVDVGFFYDDEVEWNITSVFIPLPAAIDMSDPTLNTQYAQVPIIIIVERPLFFPYLKALHIIRLYIQCTIGNLHKFDDR